MRSEIKLTQPQVEYSLMRNIGPKVPREAKDRFLTYGKCEIMYVCCFKLLGFEVTGFIVVTNIVIYL